MPNIAKKSVLRNRRKNLGGEPKDHAEENTECIIIEPKEATTIDTTGLNKFIFSFSNGYKENYQSIILLFQQLQMATIPQAALWNI